MMSYDDDFPTCKETHASLRIFSDDVGPSVITTMLGIAPSKIFAKGDVFGSRGAVRKFNGWFLSSEQAVDSKDTRRHIDWIISKIRDKSVEVAELQAKGFDIDITCLWLSTGQGGPILSPPQMKELARLNVDVWWDVYFSNRESEETVDTVIQLKSNVP